MNNVILNAKGVKHISRTETTSFPVPISTQSYCPISNNEIIDTTLEQLYKNGFNIKSEFHKCDGSKNKFVGGFVISGGDSESNLFFAYKNSYDKSMTAAYALGAQIMICSNSVVRGEQSLIRKHTGLANAIVKNGISEGIKRIGDNYLQLKNELQKMKEIEISKKIAAELVGRLYIEDEIITSHQLSVIKREINIESFNYGVKDSLFNLYQAITHSLKSSHPVSFLNSHIDAHDFFTKAAGIIVSPKPIVSLGEIIPENQLELALTC